MKKIKLIQDKTQGSFTIFEMSELGNPIDCLEIIDQFSYFGTAKQRKKYAEKRLKQTIEHYSN